MAIIKIGKRVCDNLYYLEIKSNGDNSCLIKNKHELLCRGPLQHCLNYRETIFNSLDTGYVLPPDATLTWQYTRGSQAYETVLATYGATDSGANAFNSETTESNATAYFAGRGGSSDHTLNNWVVTASVIRFFSAGDAQNTDKALIAADSTDFATLGRFFRVRTGATIYDLDTAGGWAANAANGRADYTGEANGGTVSNGDLMTALKAEDTGTVWIIEYIQG